MAGSKTKTAGKRQERIAALNDQFRQTLTGGRVLMTSGVQALGEAFTAKALTAMQQFAAFDARNDPYGEHDYGAFEVDGQRLFFKIDYYAPDMEHGSEDPADPSITTRVLTLMLADEY